MFSSFFPPSYRAGDWVSLFVQARRCGTMFRLHGGRCSFPPRRTRIVATQIRKPVTPAFSGVWPLCASVRDVPVIRAAQQWRRSRLALGRWSVTSSLRCSRGFRLRDVSFAATVEWRNSAERSLLAYSSRSPQGLLRRGLA